MGLLALKVSLTRRLVERTIKILNKDNGPIWLGPSQTFQTPPSESSFKMLDATTIKLAALTLSYPKFHKRMSSLSFLIINAATARRRLIEKVYRLTT